MSCYICLEDLNSPVSLPCGHVFCQDCLKRAVQAVQPYSTLHVCPTCRSQYFLAPLDLSTVPPHLRPHLTPSIRKVYLDLPSPKPEKSGTLSSEPSNNLSTEIARLRAENEALRHNCFMWRKRAEVHSAATLGLLELSRAAKDQVLLVSRQRDTIQKDYLRLSQDFQRQQVIIQTMMHASSPDRLGSTSHMSRPSTGVDHSAALAAESVPPAPPTVPAPRPHPTTDERPQKRPRTEGGCDDRCAENEPPTKLARRVETDLLDGPSSAGNPNVPVKTETET